MKRNPKQVVSKSKVDIPKESSKKNVYMLISALAIIVSIVYSYKLRWLGDDIFIGLRYVENLLNGNGLVYNKGERVEGFTDFLWIMLISLFTWLKRDPLVTVQTLGILSSVGTLILFSVIGYKISKQHKSFIIPYITVALALNYDYNTWATSGLETSFFSFLLCCSFYIFFFSEFNPSKKLILSGLFLCLALLTRPDTFLIVALANVLFVIDQFFTRNAIKQIIKLLFLFNLAIIVIYVPYFLWKFNYYGFIFPNTYYDKLGDESFYTKGFQYIWLYFKPHFISLLALLLPPIIIARALKNNLKEFIKDKINAAFLTSVIILYIYLVGFVAKVGGDFMYARFIIPIAPFIYFIIFYSMIKLVKKKKNLNMSFYLLLLAFSIQAAMSFIHGDFINAFTLLFTEFILSIIFYFINKSVSMLNIVLSILILGSYAEYSLRMDLFKATDKDGKEIITWNGDVSDERYVYTSYYPMQKEIKLGKALNACFSGIDARMLIKGGQACMGYFADFSYIQEFYGLTDTLIAHSKIDHRERIGHEKHGSIEYFESKGINFVFPIHARPITKDTFRFANINYDGYQIRTEILTYDNKIISQMKAKLGQDFQFTDFQRYLDDYIYNKMPRLTYDKIKSDYENFALYYFKNNYDKERENAFIEAMKSKKS